MEACFVKDGREVVQHPIASLSLAFRWPGGLYQEREEMITSWGLVRTKRPAPASGWASEDRNVSSALSGAKR